MASFSVSDGTIAITAAGNYTVTGLSFTPKLIMIFGVGTSSGVAWIDSIGCGTGSTAQWSYGTREEDNQSTTRAYRYFNTSNIFSSISSTGTIYTQASLASVTASGFIINCGTYTLARTVSYVAFGGDDLTAYAGTFNTSGSTGNQTVTGLGMTPGLLFVVGGLLGTTPGATPYAVHTRGWGVSSSSMVESSYYIADGVGTSSTSRSQRSTSIYHRHSGTTLDEFALSSFSSGQFVVNHSVAGSSNIVGIAALGGIQFNITSLAQKTSTGSQTLTGVGFTSELQFAQSFNKVTSTTIDTSASHGFGFARDSTNEQSIGLISNDSVSPSDCYHYYYAGIIRNGSASGTTNAEADLSSFNSDGSVLNWTTADGTAREFYYISMAGNAGGAEAYYKQLVNGGLINTGLVNTGLVM